MAHQDDLSPTLKTPRINKDLAQETTQVPATTDQALDATRKAPVVNRPTLPSSPANTSDHVPPVVAQPVAWWLQAPPPPEAPTTSPEATETPANEQTASEPFEAAAAPDDAATGPVPAVDLTADLASSNVDRYASSYEEYATNVFAAIPDAPVGADSEEPHAVLPPPDQPQIEQYHEVFAEPVIAEIPVSAPEIAEISADASLNPAAPAAVAPPPAWVQALQHADEVGLTEPAISAEPDFEENAMPQVQWEYCRVQLDSGSYTKSQNVGRYPYYVRVAVDYYGGEVPPTVTFSEDTDALDRPHKIWGQILGQLGLANWEMINIYTGTAKDYALVNVMAYFKRTVQPDRRVSEPKLTV